MVLATFPRVSGTDSGDEQQHHDLRINLFQVQVQEPPDIS